MTKGESQDLEAADRAERAGDIPGALIALRNHLARHQDDGAGRLRFARLLSATGARAAARQALAPFEMASSDDPLIREATRRLAELDEADGAVLAAALRWEQILADDVDDPQALAKLAMLRAGTHAAAPRELDPAATLVAPEGVETSRYRLLRELGRGATAAVYLARDVGLDLEVALKVLHAQLAGAAGADARRRFFAEARLCAGLRHPGVVAIYDVDEAARLLVMEHVPGGTLRDRIRAQPGGIPLEERNAVAQSLLTTLAFVHARGIVHGDLKPSNLLLRAPGEVVLADFGAAALLLDRVLERFPDRPGDAPGPGGTPQYLAPEQFEGAPVSPATDLYAAGAILWEATFGNPLRTHAALMHEAPLTLPPDAEDRLAAHSPEWATLVLTLLQERKNPAA
jgi:tRNA A-37 threonylcarbamoyl transferase component Bud32